MTATYRESEHPRGANGRWASKGWRGAVKSARPGAGHGGRHKRRPGLRFAATGAGVSTLTVFLLGWQAAMQLVIVTLLVVIGVTGVILSLLWGGRQVHKRSPGAWSGSLSPRRRGKIRWWQFSRRWARWTGRWVRRKKRWDQRRAYARL